MKGLKKIGLTCTLSQEAPSICIIQTRGANKQKENVGSWKQMTPESVEHRGP